MCMIDDPCMCGFSYHFTDKFFLDVFTFQMKQVECCGNMPSFYPTECLWTGEIHVYISIFVAVFESYNSISKLISFLTEL